MANTTIQSKRTTVSGRVPTTSQISIGEIGLNLTDGIAYSSNGTVVFELGANVGTQLIRTSVTVGNSTLNVFSNSTSIVLGNTTVNATINSTIFTGTANNSNYLGGIAPSSYSNTTSPIFSVSVNVGSNVTINTSTIDIGNSTVYTLINSTSFFTGNTTANGFSNSTIDLIANSTAQTAIYPGLINVGSNVYLSTTTLFIGNSTANSSGNSTVETLTNSTATTTFTPGLINVGANVSMNTSMIFIGNSTVNATVNSSVFALNGVVVGGGSINTSPYALTDGTNIAVNMALGVNFSVTLGGNRTLSNATNVVAGTSGMFNITQDSSGSRTLAYASMYVFDGDTAIVLGTTASKSSYVSYYCINTTAILMQLVAVNV
jgi:hypothetical protein